MKQKDFFKLLMLFISIFYLTNTYAQQHIWTGATDNNWDTNTNWSNNIVPPNSTDVIIPSGLVNYPTKTTGFIFLNSLIFESGSSLLLNGGSLFNEITYKRNVTSNWHLIASPIKDHTFEKLITDNATNFVTGTGTNIGIGLYDNTAASPWQYKNATSTGPITNSKGMAIKLKPTSSSIIFKGRAFDGVAKTITNSSGLTDFILIGNPYLAYLDSDIFLNHMTNSFTLTEQTIWLWDGSQYITKNLINPIKIAPTQGFFVRTSVEASVTNAMVSHLTTGDTFLKQAPKTSFELSVNNGTSKKSTKVFFIDNKTTGFDNGYDSSMFGGVKENFTVFTELVSDSNGQKLAIQTLPNANYENTVIPVGLVAKEKEKITFAVNSKNLPANVQIYLEDRKNNTLVNLSENNNTITLKNATNGIGQFYIHTSAKKLNTETVLNNLTNVSIYKSNTKKITISGLQGKAIMKVYSILGKEIANRQVNSNGVSEISFPNLSTGVYIIKLNSNLGDTITKKIIL